MYYTTFTLFNTELYRVGEMSVYPPLKPVYME